MLLRTYLNICLLRANPQDLPASHFLLVLSLIAYLSANLVTFSDTVSWARALVASVADTLLLIALVHSALLIRRLVVRGRQTLAALAGCGAFISLIAWMATTVAIKAVAPDISGVDTSALRALSPGQTQVILIVSLSCVAWFVLVFGHIFREALNVPIAGGVAIAVLYILVSTSIGAALIGEPHSNG